MNLVLFIGIGFGLIALGTAVVLVIAALRPRYTHIDKTVTDPILVDGWNLPRK
jgi:hypothetical protein